VRAFLGDYQGYLLSDGYSAYDTVDGVTQAACMAHVRRKFTDAQKASPSKKPASQKKRSPSSTSSTASSDVGNTYRPRLGNNSDSKKVCLC
jgi:hypothetical protein